MKILKISFQNINSLKGSHTIDFEQGPLKETPLFAITGPTGSGKSTILDVICLALFSEIPRMGKTTKSSVESQGSVLTRNTKEALASVMYRCKSGVFTSEWRIKVNRNGNLSDYDMSIFDENGRSLDLKKGEVPAKNAELIGLAYNQFIRSILLAQGAFAEFLQAKETERTEILEKITDGFIYRELGKMAYAKAKELKEQSADIRKLIDDYEGRLLEEAVFTQFTEKQEQLNQAILVKRAQYQQLVKAKDLKEELIKLEEKQLVVEASLSEAKRQLADFEENEGRKLAKHEQLQPFKDPLFAWHDALHDITQLNELLVAKKEEFDLVKSAKATCIEEAKKRFGNAQIQEDSYKEELQKIAEAYGKLHAELGKIETRHEGLVKSVKTLDLARVLDDVGQESNAARLLKAQKMQEQCSQQLQQIGVELQQNPFAEIKDLEQLRAVEREVDRFVQLDKELADNRQLLENQLVKLEKEQSIYAELPDRMEEHEIICQDLEKLLKIAIHEREIKRLRFSLSDHRVNLVSGEPCPLCGSLSHPWAEQAPNTSVDEQKIAQLEQRLTDANKQKQAYSNEFTRLTANLENMGSAIKNVEKTIVEQQEKAQAIKATFPYAIRKQSFSTNELTDLLKSYRQLLTQQETLLQTQNTLEKAIPLLQEIVEVSRELTAMSTDLKAMYAGTTPLQQVIKARLDEWDKMEKTLNLVAYEIQQAEGKNNALVDKQAELAVLLTEKVLEKLSYVQIKDALSDLLNHEQERQLRKSLSEITETIARFTQSVSDNKEQISDKKQQDVKESLEEINHEIASTNIEIATFETQLQEVRSAISQHQNLEKQIKDKQAELTAIQGDGYKWLLLDKHIGDATGKTFSSFAQQLTLMHLVALANNRLTQISKRYLLKAPDVSKSKDDLLIIDLEMGNEERSVKTLSGGESFIMSLALSLGLSDLAAKNIQIESLFIDEGFGTLDPESLDQVLDVLENLQANDAKTIGIISHVDALKERITTQIKLKPTGQGHSMLSIE